MWNLIKLMLWLCVCFNTSHSLMINVQSLRKFLNSLMNGRLSLVSLNLFKFICMHSLFTMHVIISSWYHLTEWLLVILRQGCEVSVKELDGLLSLLVDKKRKMEQEEAETNMQILLDFLNCLRKQKLEELNEVL